MTRGPPPPPRAPGSDSLRLLRLPDTDAPCRLLGTPTPCRLLERSTGGENSESGGDGDGDEAGAAALVAQLELLVVPVRAW